eukprot:m.163437 g.163437  ORF g.163437 m.163437 type:complete len:76 (+) comp14385_c0_seq1:610-837(+)
MMLLGNMGRPALPNDITVQLLPSIAYQHVPDGRMLFVQTAAVVINVKSMNCEQVYVSMLLFISVVCTWLIYFHLC